MTVPKYFYSNGKKRCQGVFCFRRQESRRNTDECDELFVHGHLYIYRTPWAEHLPNHHHKTKNFSPLVTKKQRKRAMAETRCNGSSGKQFKLPEIRFTKLFINGEFVDAISGMPFPPFWSFSSLSTLVFHEGIKSSSFSFSSDDFFFLLGILWVYNAFGFSESLGLITLIIWSGFICYYWLG